MKNLTISVFILSLIFTSCSDNYDSKLKDKETNINVKLVDYLYSNFDFPNDSLVYFIYILNPNSSCISCYKVGFDMLSKYTENSIIISTPEVIRFFDKSNNIKIVDSSDKIFKLLGVGYFYSSKLYIIQNKQVLDEKVLTKDNFEDINKIIDSYMK